MYRVVEIGSFSLPKPSKEMNEDFVLFPTYDQSSNIVLAVADGVGSSSKANNASKCAIDTISELVNRRDFSVKTAIYEVQRRLSSLALEDDNLKDSATTLTMLHLESDKLIIGHVGDCRAYVTRGNKLVQLTKDHTRYQELLDSREHSIKKLSKHKERLSSVITKALSSQVDLDFDLMTVPLDELFEGTSIVLTLMSDGAYDHWHKRARFSESTMGSPAAFANSLRKRIQKEPSDDFTCLSVKIEK